MATLNARANNAYHELIAETERENPGDVWAGFEHERDAFEEGWQNGFGAAADEMLARLRILRANAITSERKDAYDTAIGTVEGLR